MRLFCAPSDPTTLYLTRYAMAWRMRPTSTAFEEEAAMAAAATATAVTLRCCCVSPGDTPQQLEPGADMSIHLCALQIRTLSRSHDGHLIKAYDPQCKLINELMSPPHPQSLAFVLDIRARPVGTMSMCVRMSTL